jgi:hypothetical protein
MQVHADASNFASGVSKEEAYEQVMLQAEGLFYGQRNWVSAFEVVLFCQGRVLTAYRFGKHQHAVPVCQ